MQRRMQYFLFETDFTIIFLVFSYYIYMVLHFGQIQMFVLKGPLGMRQFQCCPFWKFTLYSLLILTKNTKKSKNYFKALKKSEIVIFPGRILPCKQNTSAICST